MKIFLIFLTSCSFLCFRPAFFQPAIIPDQTDTEWLFHSYDALIITQTVSDYSRWQQIMLSDTFPWYLEGVSGHSYSRGIDDGHLITTFQSIIDSNKAEKYISSGRMEHILREASVTGTPQAALVRVEYDNNVIMQQERIFMTQHVRDYENWKKAFKDTRRDRLKYGLVDRLIARDLRDTNKITVYLGITDMKKAHSYIVSSKYKKYLHSGGVIGDSIISWYK